jgi:hypothetical protein
MEPPATITLSRDDIKWLRENFPSLKFTQEDKIVVLRGLLGFDLYYDTNAHQMLYNPPDKYHTDKYRIKDVYKIEIKFLRNGPSISPQVREIGGELKSFSRKSGITLNDLHVQDDGTLCLCTRQEERRRMADGLDLDILFNQLIIPFFYSQSFYKKFRDRSWLDYSHGTLGTLEYYFRSQIIKDKRLVIDTLETMEDDERMVEFYSLCLKNINKAPEVLCPCPSGKKFKNCHKEALDGLKKLVSEAVYFGIQLI